MNTTHITNAAKLIEQLSRFTSFVHHMDGQSGILSFRDTAGYLGQEEDYKSRIAEEARKELDFGKWKESWIGTGKIADCAKKALNKSGNLVNQNQKTDFKNRLDPKHEKFRQNAERVLYNIYKAPQNEEPASFADAAETFGAKYDTIAFLFFVKDDTRFLPVCPGRFDKGFEILDINYSTSRRCSWENYQGFIQIIKEIRGIMEEVLPMKGTPRLIDAHSFVWVIQDEPFMKWIPDIDQKIQIEQATEDLLQGAVTGTKKRRQTTEYVFARSANVVDATRKRANGVCQYCMQPAPFIDKKGNPYLEVHHVVWLSRGGIDSTSNTVALCPNCHTRMHILDRPEDVERLKSIISGEK